jgi:hypothetical protein
MEEIKKLLDLLNQTGNIIKSRNEMLDATGGRFNIFKVCGVNHRENTHSRIIAEFLNPNGSHSLKSKLLKCFIDRFCDDDALKQIFDCDNAHVRAERGVGDYGRVDILIDDRKHHAIIIENKIYAGDQQEQLKRYDEFAENEYGEGNYQILYLTLWGCDASEQSGGGVKYKTVSYEKDIIAWLVECASIAEHLPPVRETINQYINHIKSLTHQDTINMELQEFIKQELGLNGAQQENIVKLLTKREEINEVNRQIDLLIKKANIDSFSDWQNILSQKYPDYKSVYEEGKRAGLIVHVNNSTSVRVSIYSEYGDLYCQVDMDMDIFEGKKLPEEVKNKVGHLLSQSASETAIWTCCSDDYEGVIPLLREVIEILIKS